ncbi:DsbA family protein [Sporolactobacillus sp. CPB3-1]|uniref:DsbA family protein n=1 Tax=Sporolactobacillus mangiferae TaxID=2940498 RepID=A0ABT0M8J6_9BACL|nr:thioredoxin domain-containing protein [Sporolactobacillus mangiferae]MCL1631186.1 DsbA family protein [Sporolactobacillus mangiferae]
MTKLSETGFQFGVQDAPLTLTVFTNLACPHCAAFFNNYETELLPAIENRQLRLVLKPFDKPKIGLLKGNLVHLFLDYEDQARVNPIILQLFKDQAEWKALTDSELQTYLNENYNLEVQPGNTERSLTITQEAVAFDATSVPTALLSKHGGTPVKIEQAELTQELQAVS